MVGHSDSEEIEMREMKPRRPKQYKRIRSPKSPKTPKTKMKLDVIVEPVLPGDTVQRVALRYSCPVSVCCMTVHPGRVSDPPSYPSDDVLIKAFLVILLKIPSGDNTESFVRGEGWI